MANREFKRHMETRELLSKLAQKYKLAQLSTILKDDKALLYEKDIYVCLHDIVEASLSGDVIMAALKNAKNIYNSPVFAVNAAKGIYQIKNVPDFDQSVEKMVEYSNCFKLSAYSIVSTFLAAIEAQITGFELNGLYEKGVRHIEGFIEHSLKNNPRWNKDTLTSDKPVLVIPIGAAGTGKSTFYKELSNVINISCDNVRYLLFKEFGPCFSSWESALSWWVVNQLTDVYLSKGYSVFYNGVNTDMEYRSPITMENPDPLFRGIPYDIKLVYFEPPVKLNAEELKELKSINLWTTPIEQVDLVKISANVAKIMELIKNNYQRTMTRTKEIAEGKKSQDQYDILYSVPPAIVKLFVEQSFDAPCGNNMILVPRQEIPDEKKRTEFYKFYAEKIKWTNYKC